MSRSGPDEGAGYQWTVTFAKIIADGGNTVPVVAADDAGLIGVGADVSVTSIVRRLFFLCVQRSQQQQASPCLFYSRQG